MREEHDGQTGLHPGNTNNPDGYDWTRYTTELTSFADPFKEE